MVQRIISFADGCSVSVGQEPKDKVNRYEQNQRQAEQIQRILDEYFRHRCSLSNMKHNRIWPKSSISKLGFDVGNKAPAVEDLLHMLRDRFEGDGTTSIFGDERRGSEVKNRDFSISVRIHGIC